MCLCHSGHGPRAVVHGVHRERFAAHEDCVGLWGAGRGELAGAVGGARESRKGAPGDVRRGRSVLAMMILEGMNCLDV
jgi:hypothetical protein